ncbi:hypothetical protein [Curtobacterium sp. MCBA15_001]|uniref:hypothetical protein n=1 Tax=Curtobacterium sp. MCBA15_001 TaxID=1898731 RepID=UPI0008DE575D|nr:hypothetical protein [Curtobacterium sp. MCBA15_001]OIH96970.1 hypothetical protein BIU90_15905 [Curtobacterium sp. MCBA15_001]
MSGLPHAARPTRAEVLAIAGITATFVLLLATWAYLDPPLRGPDEAANVDAVLHLLAGRPWPATGHLHFFQGVLAQDVAAQLPPVAQRGSVAALVGDGSENALQNPMSQHPPTFFLVQAAIALALDAGPRRWDHVVLVMRLVDVLAMAPLPVLVWASVRRVTRSPRLAVAAATVLLAVPQVAQLGSTVSVWVPVITAGALATWLGLRVLTGDRSWLTVLALGGAVAVGTAVMAGGFLAVPFAVVAVLAARHDTESAAPVSSRRGLVVRVCRALVVLAVPAVTTGWWYARQFLRTGSPQPDPYAPVHEHWAAGEGPDVVQFVGAFWNGMSDSFLGLLGRYQWPLSPVVVDTATVVALTALVWAATSRRVDRRTMLLVAAFPVTVLVVVVARDWASYVGHVGITVVQGRFLFPAMAALLAMLALAWQGLVVRHTVRVRLTRAVLLVAPLIAVGALGLLYSGSFEGLVFRVSAAGRQALWTSLPSGRGPLVALVGLLAVVGLATVVALWRWFGRPGADATAHATPDETTPTAHATSESAPTAHTTPELAPPSAPARLPADRRPPH